MADVMRFLQQHRGQIIRLAKKAFTWWKKKQAQGGQGGGGGGYAGAAGGGQQQQQYGQQPQYGGQQQQGGYGNQWQQQGPPQQQHQQGGWGGPPQQGGWDHPPAQGNYQAPSSTFPVPSSGVKPNHPNYHDNEINQKNERYKSLRSSAHSEGDAMAKCFDESHKAYSAGDGNRAKQLSNEGHQHKMKMEQLNREAADWIFQANNEDSGPDEIDLHGLYVQEAIERTEQRVKQAQSQGRPTLRVITGKGVHSAQHVAKIRPAIEKLMQQQNLGAEMDPHNAGVVVVHLAGGGGRRDAGFTRELARSATGNEEQCTVM